MPQNDTGFVSGYAAIVGRPNVGKSTLLNHLAQMRLAIVSPKPQTTRHTIRYIHDDGTSQIIFTDTPGMHTPRSRLGEKMMEQAVRAIKDADVVLLIVDAGNPAPSDTERNCCEVCAKWKKPILLLLNKCDKVQKEKLLPVIARYSDFYAFDEIIPISALQKDGIGLLLEQIRKRLPEGPRFYPEDSLTDQTEKDIAAELIREQILKWTSEEIPHGTAVEIEKFTEKTGADDSAGEEGSPRSLAVISAVIYCERDSHKRILIGNKGEMIRRIGIGARENIEALLQCKVHLELFVKVRKDWRNDPAALADLGYTSGRD